MESKIWQETFFDFVESAAGLTVDFGRTVLQRVIAYIRWVLRWTVIGIVPSAVCGVLGAYFDIGLLVFIGIVGIGAGITFAFVALAPAVLVLWAAEEKSEKVQRLAVTAFTIMASFLIIGVYVVVFGAWRNKEFWVLMPIVVIFIMASVVRGSFIDPKKITNWAVRVGIIVIGYIIISTAIEKVPEYYRARVADSAGTLVGLNSDEVTYESIDKFFSSDGKPQAWYVEYKGQRHFFLSPGYDQRYGLPRVPITREIIEQEDDIRAEAKLAAEEKVIADQKAAEAEAARLKAEEDAKQEVQRVADELARQQQEEQARQRAETERVAREQQEKMTILFQAVIQTAVSTDTARVEDRVSATLAEPVGYNGHTFPAGSQVEFMVVGFSQKKWNSPPKISLRPVSLIDGSLRQSFGARAELIELTPKGQIQSNTNIGTAVGAGTVTTGITTKGKNMKVSAGYSLKIVINPLR